MEGWTEVTPEYSERYAEANKREPTFAALGSSIQTGVDNKMDLPLTDEYYATVTSYKSQEFVTISLFDVRTNLPVMPPEDFKVNMVEWGSLDAFFGTYFLKPGLDHELKVGEERKYLLKSTHSFKVEQQ